MKKLGSLRIKIPFIIVSTVTIMIIGLLSALIYLFSDAITKVAVSGFQDLSTAYASRMDNWVYEKKEMMKLFSTTSSSIDYLETKNEESRAILDRDLSYKFDLLKDKYNAFYILDLDGNILLSYSDSSEDYYSKSDNSSDLISLKNSNYEFSISSEIKKLNDKLSLNIYSGIRNSAGNVLGILAVTLKWDEFLKVYYNPITVGKSGRTFLISDIDGIIGHKNPNILGNTVVKEINKQARGNNEKGVIKFLSMNTGLNSIMIFTTLNNIPWTSAVSIDESEFYSSVTTITYITVIVTILILIITAIVIILYVTKKITNVLEDLATCVTKLGDGDLSFKIPDYILKRSSNSGDELEQISYGFNMAFNKLQNIISDIHVIASSIDSMSSDISSSNDGLLDKMENASRSIDGTVSSMSKIDSTIKASTKMSIDADNMMTTSQESVEEASLIIEQTTSNIEKVFDTSTKISSIVKIIEDIAFQTNILALNASVEAARAGEQGKGFAVVAAEVRNLAQNTQNSAKDITNLVLESETNIKNATEIARKSKNIFIEIKNKIDDTSKIIEEMSSTAIEQQREIEQLNRAILDISSNIQENVSFADKSKTAGDGLSRTSHRLVDIINYFKI